jgi:hypothetical protein
MPRASPTLGPVFALGREAACPKSERRCNTKSGRPKDEPRTRPDNRRRLVGGSRRALDPRRAGSARFNTYYKVQWYDDRSGAWVDIQKRHPTAEAAILAYPAGKRCRIMEVTLAGHRPPL